MENEGKTFHVFRDLEHIQIADVVQSIVALVIKQMVVS